MKEGILELVPEKLYRLGGTVEADPRISWLPAGRDGYEPINAYLLLEGNRAVLIDTGVTLHGDLIVEQLRSLLPPDPVLSIFLTRIEMDCISNLGRVGDSFPIESVHAGGASNPFDFFDDLEASAIGTRSARLERIKGDGELALSDTRTLRVLKTKLRLLSTTWAFDEGTGTLFTSDSFGYLGLAEASQEPLSANGYKPSVESVFEHIVAKFDFLLAADPDDIRAGVAEIFERHDVQIIAPCHGCAVSGRELVKEHVRIVDEALSMCGKGPR